MKSCWMMRESNEQKFEGVKLGGWRWFGFRHLDSGVACSF